LELGILAQMSALVARGPQRQSTILVKASPFSMPTSAVISSVLAVKSLPGLT
jgi:hypothetical protein